VRPRRLVACGLILLRPAAANNLWALGSVVLLIYIAGCGGNIALGGAAGADAVTAPSNNRWRGP
jgi:hypothetical protein